MGWRPNAAHDDPRLDLRLCVFELRCEGVVLLAQQRHHLLRVHLLLVLHSPLHQPCVHVDLVRVRAGAKLGLGLGLGLRLGLGLGLGLGAVC